MNDETNERSNAQHTKVLKHYSLLEST